MKQIFICSLLLITKLFFTPAKSQTRLSIENVYTYVLRNSGVIFEGPEIRGYYLFYQSDKVNKKLNEYTLRILDENLGVAKDIKFTDSKEIELKEAAFNGSNLIFAFFNGANYTLSFKVYDFSGQNTISYEKKVKSFTGAYYKLSKNNDDEGENKNIFPAADSGFVSLIHTKNLGSSAFEVNYWGSKEKKEWSFKPEKPGSFYYTAQMLGINDGRVYVCMSRQKAMSMMGSKNDFPEYFLLCLDLQTGEKLFEVKTANDQLAYFPQHILSESTKDAIKIVCPYFKPDAFLTQAKPLGIAQITLDGKGNITADKQLSWGTDFSKFLKVDDKGFIENMGYLFFHDILKASNGKYYAIAEGFIKKDEGAALAAIVLTNSSGFPGKIETGDMVLMEFDSDFRLSKLDVYPKAKNYYLAANTGMMASYGIANAVKHQYGGFDFCFMHSNSEKSWFSAGYINAERKDGKIKDVSFNTITFSGNTFTTDKINLTTQTSILRVMPGKPGSVLILEYFRKEKKLELRMEKIN